MEKYELNGNIIITTKERYEKMFKNLGYKPYNEKQKNIEKEDEETKETKKTRKIIKEN